MTEGKKQRQRRGEALPDRAAFLVRGDLLVPARSLGLPNLHFHDLRHVARTLTAASGASTELMHRMGHVSPAAALRYQHATRDRDAVIAAALGDLIAPAPATVTTLRPAGTGH